jgi:hypothetical protein
MMGVNGWEVVEFVDTAPMCTSPVEFIDSMSAVPLCTSPVEMVVPCTSPVHMYDNMGISVGTLAPSVKFTAAVPTSQTLLGPIVDDGGVIPVMPIAIAPLPRQANRSPSPWRGQSQEIYGNNSSSSRKNTRTESRGPISSLFSSDSSSVRCSPFMSKSDSMGRRSGSPHDSRRQRHMSPSPARTQYTLVGNSRQRSMSPPPRGTLFGTATTVIPPPVAILGMDQTQMMLSYPGVQMVPAMVSSV